MVLSKSPKISRIQFLSCIVLQAFFVCHLLSKFMNNLLGRTKYSNYSPKEQRWVDMQPVKTLQVLLKDNKMILQICGNKQCSTLWRRTQNKRNPPAKKLSSWKQKTRSSKFLPKEITKKLSRWSSLYDLKVHPSLTM